jgi:hypothetical protein
MFGADVVYDVPNERRVYRPMGIYNAVFFLRLLLGRDGLAARKPFQWA